MRVGILFPHQLFEETLFISKCDTIYFVEEYLFFKQYNFHKQKIAFHRASMKFYESYLLSKNINVIYVDSFSEISDLRELIRYFNSIGIKELEYIDTTDYLLQRRIEKACKTYSIRLNKHQSALFLNTPDEINSYFSERKRMFQTDFYKNQRLSRNILLEDSKKPIGGKWTFDDENRLKYPKGKTPPKVDAISVNDFYKEAIEYTQKHFPDNYGKLNSDYCYPTTFDESKKWLNDFLKTRFSEFGAYEDAIVSNQTFLHHSILTPMLNVGLLTPQFIIDETLQYASNNEIPLNSLEGFIRQIVGWREFIRAVYQLKGIEERTKNYAYDWVMVPNVYGMSQFADGGIMSTKPYISGSNYLMKMSDYKKGDWQQVWDGLFWRFMHTHRDFFLQNPRLGMLVKTFDKMLPEKQAIHLSNASNYLNQLDSI